MEKVLFSEKQKFDRVRLPIIICVLTFVPLAHFVFGIYRQEVLNKPFGRNPADTSDLIVSCIISLIVVAFVILLIISLKLKTKITDEALWIVYPPIRRKWKK